MRLEYDAINEEFVLLHLGRVERFHLDEGLLGNEAQQALHILKKMKQYAGTPKVERPPPIRNTAPPPVAIKVYDERGRPVLTLDDLEFEL